MSQPTTARALVPEASSGDVVTDILRPGAQKILAAAIQAEVDGYISEHAGLLDTDGHRLVVRNGYLPERMLQSGVGPVTIRQPRIDDRRVDDAGEKMKFTSRILPPYLRRTRSIEDLLPWLYLKGISTGDFSAAVAALLGPNAPGLSPTTIVRLKQIWEKEHEDWSRRSFEGKRFVYFWVDGVYLRICLGESEKQCVLVVMGTTEDGCKELVHPPRPFLRRPRLGHPLSPSRTLPRDASATPRVAARLISAAFAPHPRPLANLECLA